MKTEPAQELSLCNEMLLAFAESCEEMDAYTRRLWNVGDYRYISPPSGIRNYETGWKLEKWVQMLLDEDAGIAAEWWLTLSYKDNAFIVASFIRLTHHNFHHAYPDRTASSVGELRQALAEAVSELVNALEQNRKFKSAVYKYLRKQQFKRIVDKYLRKR